MDLSNLPVPAEKKVALKAAILSAGEGLSDADRLSLYIGAMYGASEVERGRLAPPGPVERELGQHFVDGRDLVVNFFP